MARKKQKIKLPASTLNYFAKQLYSLYCMRGKTECTFKTVHINPADGLPIEGVAIMYPEQWVAGEERFIHLNFAEERADGSLMEWTEYVKIRKGWSF